MPFLLVDLLTYLNYHVLGLSSSTKLGKGCGLVCTAVCRKGKVVDIDLTFHDIFDGCDQRI